MNLVYLVFMFLDLVIVEIIRKIKGILYIVFVFKVLGEKNKLNINRIV